MATQSLNSSTLEADRRQQVPERNELGASPLGSVGNLQYSVEQGGTARASWASTLCTDIGYIVSTLALSLTCPSEQAEAKYMGLVQVHYASRILGDLLGSLTARRDDREGRAKIVQALTDLSRISENDLSTLVSWRHSLSTYMSELKDADIRALRDGVLGSQTAKLVVLNQISRSENDPSRQLASQVLGKIEKELRHRMARDSAKIR